MRKYVILGLIATVFGVAALWFWGRPAYRGYRERHSLALAHGFMREGDHKKAWLSVRQVLAMNPNNIEACRMTADLADFSRLPTAVVWRRKVAELAPTIDNRLMLASCALRY